MNGDEACNAQAAFAPMAASDCCEGLPPNYSATPNSCDDPPVQDEWLKPLPVIDGFEDVVSTNPKDIAARTRCPLHLIPPIAEGEIAWVLSDGAEKYGRYNWRSEKISLLNYLGAMRRHINRILDGEDSDKESGLLHLAHIAATACIVMDAMDHDCVIDDRPNG